MFQYVVEVIETSPSHPIKNFKKFSEAHIDFLKFEKNSWSFFIKIYTSVNFFRIFGANVRFLTSKWCFFAFILFRALICSKNSTEVYVFIINSNEFFRDFLELMCASEKSLNFSIHCWGHWNVTHALTYRNFQRFF